MVSFHETYIDPYFLVLQALYFSKFDCWIIKGSTYFEAYKIQYLNKLLSFTFMRFCLFNNLFVSGSEFKTNDNLMKK